MAKRKLDWTLDAFIEERREADPKFRRTFDKLDASERAALSETARTIRELVALRKARRLTQRQVAEALGVSQPFIAKLERGTEPVGLRMLSAYALVVGGRISIVAEDGPKYGKAP